MFLKGPLTFVQGPSILDILQPLVFGGYPLLQARHSMSHILNLARLGFGRVQKSLKIFWGATNEVVETTLREMTKMIGGR